LHAAAACGRDVTICGADDVALVPRFRTRDGARMASTPAQPYLPAEWLIETQADVVIG
jgi:hypothetical protein